MRRVRQIFGFAFAQWVFIAWGFFFLSPAYGIDLTIRWDPSDASNLLGYKIYYKTGSPGQPYQGEEALEGSSPIQVHAYEVTTGEVCEFTFTDLDERKTYFFAVTACDMEGNESRFSNETCFNCSQICECTLVPDKTNLYTGDILSLQATLLGHSGVRQEVWFGTMVTKPDMSRSDFIWGPFRIELSPGEVLSGQKTHRIPVGLEPGVYTYHGYVANYEGDIVYECPFHFEVFEK